MRQFIAGSVTTMACYAVYSYVMKNESTEQTEGSGYVQRGGTILKYGAPKAAPSISYYSNHALAYDQSKKTPRWVAEHLTAENLKGKANRKHSKFKSDPRVPEMFSAKNGDYRKSGWSRGHMAPAGDNKENQVAMDESFLYTNVVPQDLDNNAGFWNRFEMYCRDLTKRFSDVRIISGPLMVPHEEENGKMFVKYQVLGEGQVAVPTHLYKVIVVEKEGDRAIGAFVVPNEPISAKHELKEYQVSLESVEEEAGLTFYPKLERNALSDLCKVDSCQLINMADFELYFTGRKLESARTLHRVERVWKELEEKNIEPTPELTNMYNKKREELRSTEGKDEL